MLNFGLHSRTKKIHQNLYSLFCWQDLCNHRFQSDKGALDNLADRLAKVRHSILSPPQRQYGRATAQSLFIDRGVTTAKMDDTDDTVRIADLAMHFRQVKGGKQIAWKRSLGYPAGALADRPPESEPGAENGHVFRHAQMCRCHVLVLRLRPDAKPLN
jgi:hypothetical protein